MFVQARSEESRPLREPFDTPACGMVIRPSLARVTRDVQGKTATNLKRVDVRGI